VLAEDERREHEDIGVVVLPGLRWQAGLDAGLLKEGVAVPALLDRHLRQQQSLDISLLHNQSVFADFNLFDIQYTPERRQDGNLILKQRQFCRADGLEAVVLKCRIGRHVADGLRQRFHGRDVADAAAQLGMLFEGDKRAAGFLQAREAG